MRPTGRAPTNVRSWESNGLNADVAFGLFMTRLGRERLFLLRCTALNRL
jgi:hypothetical protein